MSVPKVAFIVILRSAIEKWQTLRDDNNMPKPGNKIHIPLSEKEAVDLLLRVKPTADMPKPGTHPQKPKDRPEQKRKRNYSK